MRFFFAAHKGDPMSLHARCVEIATWATSSTMFAGFSFGGGRCRHTNRHFIACVLAKGDVRGSWRVEVFAVSRMTEGLPRPQGAERICFWRRETESEFSLTGSAGFTG